MVAMNWITRKVSIWKVNRYASTGRQPPAPAGVGVVAPVLLRCRSGADSWMSQKLGSTMSTIRPACSRKGTAIPNAAESKPPTAGPKSWPARATPSIHCTWRARSRSWAVSAITASRDCCHV